LERVNQEYLTILHFRFRDDLQFLGQPYRYDGEPVSPEEGYIPFNADGSMDKYKTDYCVKRDYFDKFSKLDHVVDYELGQPRPKKH